MTESDDKPVEERRSPPAVRIGSWLVQPQLNRLSRDEEEKRIEPRLMRVLVCLIEARGDVVTRDELLDRIWTDSFVCEEALTQAVSELRRLLGDKARSPRYIETIRKGGYRLVATVTPVEFEPPVVPAPDDATSPVAVFDTSSADLSADTGPDLIPPGESSPAAPPPTPSLPSSSGRRGARLTPLRGLALLVILIGALSAVRFWPRAPIEEVVGPAWSAVLPLSSYPGREAHPALAPDGERVAFTWLGAPDGDLDIYVKDRGRETPRRLTEGPGRKAHAAWSPDGERLAYIGGGDEGSAVYVIPVDGGEAEEVYRSDHWIQGVDWSPAGTELACSARPDPQGAYRILEISLETRSTRAVTAPPVMFAGDFEPRYSPDGASMAFARGDMAYLTDIHLTPVAGGSVTRLTDAQQEIRGLDWSRDGDRIVFAAAPRGDFALWEVPVTGGEIRRLAEVAERIWGPTVAARAGHVAFESVRYAVDIRRLDLSTAAGDSLILTGVVASTRRDFSPDLSADGEHLVFLSDRSGEIEVWTSGADGDDPVRRTHFGGSRLERPRWSPDGRTIAFNAVVDGFPAIHLLAVDGTGDDALRRLTPRGQNELFSCWSGDGRWLYFSSNPEGTWQIYRMRLDGSRFERISARGGLKASETPGGDALYFNRPGSAGLWRKDLPDGPEIRVLEWPLARDRGLWAVGGDGVYYVRRTGGRPELTFLPHGGDTGRPVARIENLDPGSFAVDPRGEFLLLSIRERQEGDVLIMEAGDRP